jgi:hypothetical protein
MMWHGVSELERYYTLTDLDATFLAQKGGGFLVDITRNGKNVARELVACLASLASQSSLDSWSATNVQGKFAFAKYDIFIFKSRVSNYLFRGIKYIPVIGDVISILFF